jgi:hypothetical protein
MEIVTAFRAMDGSLHDTREAALAQDISVVRDRAHKAAMDSVLTRAYDAYYEVDHHLEDPYEESPYVRFANAVFYGREVFKKLIAEMEEAEAPFLQQLRELGG